MNIKFKSFHDYTITQGMFNEEYTETIAATKQIEDFIAENKIEYISIKDIKFTVDNKINEHILLIYEEADNEN